MSLIFSTILETYVVFLENPGKTITIGMYSLKHYTVFLIMFLAIFSIYLNKDLKSKALDFIYKYRYPIGLITFLICVLFEIHGSSFGLWDNFLGYNHHTLIGLSRGIRSDEWDVFTSFTFSQYYNNFSYFSSIPRATPTDMFAVYGAPVLNILLIFRPFQLKQSLIEFIYL